MEPSSSSVVRRAWKGLPFALFMLAWVGAGVRRVPAIGCRQQAAAQLHARMTQWWWGESIDIRDGELVYERAAPDAPHQRFRRGLSCGELESVLGLARLQLPEDNTVLQYHCRDYESDVTLTENGKARVLSSPCSQSRALYRELRDTLLLPRD